jgi:hypothetical protein
VRTRALARTASTTVDMTILMLALASPTQLGANWELRVTSETGRSAEALISPGLSGRR